MSGARVPKIILFDLLCSAEPLFRIIALTSLNSIVKCNYIFDQLGSMFSVVLLFFFFSPCLRYVNSCSRVSRPVIFDHIFDKCENVRSCVRCLLFESMERVFRFLNKGFFFRSSFLDLDD